MEADLTALALLTAVGIIAAAGIGLRMRLDIQKLRKKMAERLTDCDVDVLFDERAIDSKCDICFGRFGNGEMLAECTCGKAFHRDCVSLTGECPYCRQISSKMNIREMRRKICPVCGRELTEGSLCECGNVLPRLDGVFKCVCGKDLHVKDGYCRTCGAEYEPYYIGQPGGARNDGKK